MDFDTVRSDTLDRFRYVITTDAAYQSTPPPQAREVARDGDYVLWEMRGRVRPSETLEEGGAPGATLDCDPTPAAQGSEADDRCRSPSSVRPTAGAALPRSRRRASPSQKLDLAPGRWLLSLQYHSQAPLTVAAGEASEAVRRTASWAARPLARRHVPDPPGPGRLLARRRDRGAVGEGGDRDPGERRGAELAPARPRRRRARSGSAKSPRPASTRSPRTPRSPRSATPAATYVDHYRPSLT